MAPENPNAEADWNIWDRKVSQWSRQLSGNRQKAFGCKDGFAKKWTPVISSG